MMILKSKEVERINFTRVFSLGKPIDSQIAAIRTNERERIYGNK
jgi:hypothetical protein